MTICLSWMSTASISYHFLQMISYLTEHAFAVLFFPLSLASKKTSDPHIGCQNKLSKRYPSPGEYILH